MSSVVVEQERAVARPRAGAPDEAPHRLVRAIAYVVLVGVALLMFVPFFWSVVTSLKTSPEAALFPPTLLPEQPTLDAYRTIMLSQGVPFGRWFLNSALVAATVVAARSISNTMAAYAFARMRFPGRDALFALVLSTMMAPAIILIIPRFIVLQRLGLLDTLHALWIPTAADAFGIFLMRQYFETIPAALEEAARIDGAGRFRMFWQIVLPNATPALAAMAIFAFQGSWNNFLDAVIFISGGNRDSFTLPLGLAYFRNFYYTDWPVVMAGAVITTLPIALAFLLFQRAIIEGVTHTAVKG
jgi:multiple sugar transport system permease protein